MSPNPNIPIQWIVPEHLDFFGRFESVDHTAMSNRERETSHKRAQILDEVEGGKYHTQVAKETRQIS